MFDCHVHSTFSADSEMPAAKACEIAYGLGLEGLAFTDHLDYDFPDFELDYLIDFDKYSEFMNELKAEQAPRLKVLKGIEVGIQSHVIEDTLKVVKKYDFDFVIASVHIVDGMDPYNKVYYNGKSKLEAYSRYLEHVLFMVENYKDYDVVGHIDYIIRKADYDDRSMSYADHADLIDVIFEKVISEGKGIEVNTGSYRDYPGVVTPKYDFNILKRYKELGGEIVTFGSDAHYLEHLGNKFHEFKQRLLQIGFTHTAHFEQRKPVFDRIAE